MKKFYCLALLSVVIILSTIRPSFAASDSQLWLAQWFSGKINDTVSASAVEYAEWHNDMSRLSYHFAEMGLKFKLPCKLLTAISLNYRQIYILRTNGNWEQEKRPLINVYFDLPEVKGYKLSNRVRFEYRDKVDWNDWRIRNAFQITAPHQWTKFKIQPYIAEEIKYDFHADQLNSNELSIGIKTRPFKNIHTSIYYLWASSKSSGKWNDTHILGVSNGIAF